MVYSVWSPSDSIFHRWEPSTGWNRAFSEKERMECARLYVFFTTKKHLSSDLAEQYAQMTICKQKYHGLLYSAIQEGFLASALQPIIQ